MNQNRKTTNFAMQTRLRPALMAKTDYVDTIGAGPGNQDVKRFLTINLHRTRQAWSRKRLFIGLGVPGV